MWFPPIIPGSLATRFQFILFLARFKVVLSQVSINVSGFHQLRQMAYKVNTNSKNNKYENLLIIKRNQNTWFLLTRLAVQDQGSSLLFNIGSEAIERFQCGWPDVGRRLKRLKRYAPPSLNKNSNEEQLFANKSVLEDVEHANAALDRKDLQKTKKVLDRDDDKYILFYIQFVPPIPNNTVLSFKRKIEHN